MRLVGVEYSNCIDIIAFPSCVYRFDVKCTVDELKNEWSGLLKNKDGTVNFQEFLRQFSHSVDGNTVLRGIFV